MPFSPWTPGGALLAAARGMDGFPSPSLSRSRACVRGRRKENSFFIPCHPLPSEREKARPVRKHFGQAAPVDDIWGQQKRTDLLCLSVCLSVCLIMGENLMLSTPFFQMFQGLRAFALPFRRLEKAVLRGAVRALPAGRSAASPHPKARTIQRPGKGV